MRSFGIQIALAIQIRYCWKTSSTFSLEWASIKVIRLSNPQSLKANGIYLEETVNQLPSLSSSLAAGYRRKVSNYPVISSMEN